MPPRSFDEICGYALELVVGGLRGLRDVLGRVIVDDEPSSLRPSAARGYGNGRDPWQPRAHADRVADEPSLRDALGTPAPLPHAYADDRVVLLTRDPHTLFAYWDLAPGTPEPAGAASARLVLRIHDLSLLDFADARPLRHHDFDVDRLVGSRYVPTDGSGGTYRAEIGWRWNDGRFVARVRSGTITTARADAPGTGPARWMTVARLGSSERAPDAAPARPAVTEAPAPSRAPSAPASRPAAPAARAPSSEEQHRRGG
ncbi:MAG TPA: DUF4912 domain-containing protein [Candidatus Binatia bacterium]